MPYFGNYETPKDVLLDKSLSTEEKVEVLEQWREDKEALARASSEGMVGDDRAHILKAIEDAITSLSR
ncbi:hypothetical protein [Roseomonas chloroacetimidivorans]|uniref:hypothetical protein n=1 Tax=Roseomonas chloroacetimidivorans TaxID=1766656 RepID=UPI003C74E9CA